jgi:hypothetical protein
MCPKLSSSEYARYINGLQTAAAYLSAALSSERLKRFAGEPFFPLNIIAK